MSDTRKSLTPIIIGIATTAALLVFLAYAASKRRAQIDAVPRITLILPADGETVTAPLVIRFRTTVPLQLEPMGWMAAKYHLHAWIDNTQLMPAANDIRKASDDSYEWRVPQLPAGDQQQFRLSWADARHNPIPEGASSQISLSVR